MRSPIDALYIDETNLDSSYPGLQLNISAYQYPPYHKDRNKYGGGKILFLREGLIATRLRNFEGDTSENICLEPTISKEIWFVIFAYRPPIDSNKYKRTVT